MALSSAAEAFQKAIAAAKANPPAGRTDVHVGEDGLLRVGGITFRRHDDLLANGIPEPQVLVADLLYDGANVHLVSGHPAHGKTTLVAHIAHMVMAQNRPVVWLDYETGHSACLRRQLAIGTTPQTLRDLFNYADFPADAERHLLAIGEHFSGALIVIDSMSKALAAAGISENANDEVTSWTVQVVKACKSAGMPVVIIDHVSKAGGGSDYSRGAGAKLADVDCHWRVEKTSEFNRTEVGEIVVSLKKDREGYLPAKSIWRVGDGNGGLPIVRAEASAKADSAATALREQVLAHLAANAGVEFTKTQIRSAVEGNNENIAAAIESLATDLSVAVHQLPGKRVNSFHYIYDPSRGSAEDVPI